MGGEVREEPLWVPPARPAEEVRAAVEGADVEALKQSDFVYALLLTWLQAALELQDAAAAKKEADDAAAAAAAAAAENADE